MIHRQRQSFSKQYKKQVVAQYLAKERTLEDILGELHLRKDQFQRWVDAYQTKISKQELKTLAKAPTVPKFNTGRRHLPPITGSAPISKPIVQLAERIHTPHAVRDADSKDHEILRLKAKIHDLYEEINLYKARLGISKDKERHQNGEHITR